MFAGLTASVVGILHPFIYFPLYEKSKIYFKKHFEAPGAEDLSSKYVFLAATFSKGKSLIFI